MLAESLDVVIGVDTHKHTHSAAVVTPTGAVSTTSPCRRVPRAIAGSSPSPSLTRAGSGRWRAAALAPA